MLARACGGEAQAVALVDSWITELVRDRARAAALHLDLGSLTGLRLLFSFGLGLGLPLPGRPARAAQARVRLPGWHSESVRDLAGVARVLRRRWRPGAGGRWCVR